uniref:Transcription factor Adf-1-like n=1 Tax=Diabrotica virgifera virgifera TaxID=50390 RepID=A0A6P7FF07_DIAVI
MSKTNSKKEQYELLIELIKSNRTIYDTSDVNYKSNIEKHKCWEKISEIIDMPIPECKKRWRSLRDQYHKKRKELGTGPTGVDTSWEYGTLLSFLSDSEQEKRESRTNQSTIQQTLSSPTQHFLEDDTQNTGQEEIEEDDIHESMQGNIQREMQKNTQKRAETPNPKRSRHNSTLELLNKRQDERSLVYKRILENHGSSQPSAIRKFLDSMADIVETFPPRDQADIRLKVCQLVTEREIQLSMLQSTSDSVDFNFSDI